MGRSGDGGRFGAHDGGASAQRVGVSTVHRRASAALHFATALILSGFGFRR